MKKRLVYLLFVIFFISFSSASISINALNDNLQPGETFVAQVGLELKTSLTKENLKIYEERREVLFEKDVIKHGNNTFFYIIFSKEGEYKISADNLLYYEGDVLKEGSINYSVKITKTSNKSLTIKPGIIFGENLTTFLVNNGLEKIEVSYQGEKVEIGVNESKKVSISPEKEFFYIDFGSYRTFKIPVIYLNLSEEKNTTATNISHNETEEKNKTGLIVSPLILKEYFIVNNSKKVFVNIKNTLNKTISVSLSSDMVGMNFSKEELLFSFEEKIIPIDFFSDKITSFSGTLTIKFDEEINLVELEFYVLGDESEYVGDLYQGEVKTCSDLGGISCSIETECVGGERRFTGSEMCCIGGSCEKYASGSEKKSPLWGIIFFLVAGGIAYFLYKRFKDVKPKPKL